MVCLTTAGHVVCKTGVVSVDIKQAAWLGVVA